MDYTEDEIRELANVKLEKFLDPSRVRSELLTYYRQAATAPAGTLIPQAPPNYVFEDEMPYASSPGLGGRTIRLIRKLLNPILKLFINPNPFIHVLNMQGQINAQNTRRIDHLLVAEQLNFEIIHNLVVEMTRLAIEVKNLKMRVESLTGRLDFTERRARALESVVQYKPGSGPAAESAHSAAPSRARASNLARASRRAGATARRQAPAPASQRPGPGPGPGPGWRRHQRRGAAQPAAAAAARARRRGRPADRWKPGDGRTAGRTRRSGADDLNFDEPSGSEPEPSDEGAPR